MSQDFSRPPKITPRGRRRAGPESTAANETAGEESGAPALPEISARDAVRYVADTLAELARLSRRFDFDTLAYMIDVAHLEAQSSVHGDAPADAPIVKPGRR